MLKGSFLRFWYNWIISKSKGIISYQTFYTCPHLFDLAFSLSYDTFLTIYPCFNLKLVLKVVFANISYWWKSTKSYDNDTLKLSLNYEKKKCISSLVKDWLDTKKALWLRNWPDMKLIFLLPGNHLHIQILIHLSSEGIVNRSWFWV